MSSFPADTRLRVVDVARIAVGVLFGLGALALALTGEVFGAIVGSGFGLVVAVENQKRLARPEFSPDAIDETYRPQSLFTHAATATAMRICVVPLLVAAVVTVVFSGKGEIGHFAEGFFLGLGAIFALVVLHDDVKWAAERRRVLAERQTDEGDGSSTG